MSGKEKKDLGFGALLHDVGKIAVSDNIILKQGELSDPEWNEMRRHPGAGYDIVRKIGFLQQAADIVHAHHEHFDGSGYPRGLKEEEIPFGARIFAVADAYDALTSERPYHKALKHEEAVKLIRENSGTVYDPKVVEVLTAIELRELEEICKSMVNGPM